jgi:integrase
MRERSPGHWQLRVFAGADEAGHPLQLSKTFVGGERQAGKALAEFVAEVEKGSFDRTRATVGELLDKWLEHIESLGRRPSTIAGYRNKIEHTIRPELGEIKLSRLRADDLDARYRKWTAKGLAPATVRQCHAILSAALHQAEKWAWIARSPASHASPPTVHQKDLSVPTPEQLQTLVSRAEATDTVLGTAVALAALTGARRGELAALRWSDVDLDSGRLRIAKSLVLVAGDFVVGPTKTHQVRTIALDGLAVEVLRRRLLYMEELSTKAESPLVEDPYVLSYNANGGRAVVPDTISHRFAAICRSLRTGRNDNAWSFRFHDLRHFSVTTLIAAGVDVRTVSERHGHAQATMTLNRYAHALPERDREAAAILGRTLGG